jgi:hypothetical protein
VADSGVTNNYHGRCDYTYASHSVHAAPISEQCFAEDRTVRL